jgi:hypothetical protein
MTIGTRALACAAVAAAAWPSGFVVGCRPVRASPTPGETSETAPSKTAPSETPVEGHPLHCGEPILRVGIEWREVLEGELRPRGDDPGCAETSWLEPVDVTKRIVALDGERITKVAVRYPKDFVGIGGRTFLVDESQITEEGQRADGGLEPLVAQNADRIRSDAALVERSGVAWPLPPALARSTAPVVLPFDTIMRAFGWYGDGVLDTGKLTLRPRGVATRAFGRTRAFDARIQTSQGSAGMCHTYEAKLDLRGTMWFAENENVLVEAHLEGDPVWTDSLCTTCGKSGQERCPPRVCGGGHATLTFRLLCDG